MANENPSPKTRFKLGQSSPSWIFPVSSRAILASGGLLDYFMTTASAGTAGDFMPGSIG